MDASLKLACILVFVAAAVCSAYAAREVCAGEEARLTFNLPQQCDQTVVISYERRVELGQLVVDCTLFEKANNNSFTERINGSLEDGGRQLVVTLTGVRQSDAGAYNCTLSGMTGASIPGCGEDLQVKDCLSTGAWIGIGTTLAILVLALGIAYGVYKKCCQ